MKIGVDIRHQTCGLGTGGARVLENCLTALGEPDSGMMVFPYNRFSGKFWSSTKAGRILAAVIADVVNKNITLPLWSRIKKLDVLLYALPPISFTQKRTPQICFILDVPLKNETCSADTGIYNNIYIKQSCLRSDVIFTISQDAANAIARCYQVSPEKIKVVYLCVDFDYMNKTAACKPLPGRDGFLLGIISRISWRKNPGAYLEIFKLLPEEVRKRYPLLLAGAVKSIDDLREYVCDETIEHVRDDVICHGKVSDDVLIGYLKGANALLFPSRHEGFGLPALEAIACGTPVIASDIPVFRELYSEVASLYAPDDHQGMAMMLGSILRGESLPLNEQKVKTWLRQFSFDTYAKRLRSLMKESCE